jgi:NADH:ubiquinone oxidoreductase subunit E
MEIKVCVGSSCHLKGSTEIVKSLQSLIETHRLSREITLVGSFCMGRCQEPDVTIMIDNVPYKTSPAGIDAFFTANVLSRFNN